jgi:hypothetical protein
MSWTTTPTWWSLLKDDFLGIVLAPFDDFRWKNGAI